MQQKLKNLYGTYRPRVRELQDIRVIGRGVFVAVVLLVSWSGIKTIDTNYQLQKQITALQQQNQLENLGNQNLRLENDYYRSNQYLELSARQNFGLAAPGETELLVPQSVALAHVVPDAAAKQPSVKTSLPTWQRNAQAWADFFLHRPGSNE